MDNLNPEMSTEKHNYPITMFEDAAAKIVAVSDDECVLYWHEIVVGRFGTSMAAIRYMNAELF